jgi:hypothetical protein
MSYINGTLVLVQLGDTPKTLAHSSATWNSSYSPVELENKENGKFTAYLEDAGKIQASIDVDADADFSKTDGNAYDLAGYVQTRKNIAFVFGPDSGGFTIEGNAMCSSLNITAAAEDKATLSGTLSVNGTWTLKTST